MSHAPLCVMTRPQGQADGLLAQLQKRGLSACHLELVALRPVSDAPAARQRLLAALPCEQVIFPSANAVHHALALVGSEALASSGLAAVGPATAGSLQAAGLDHVYWPGLQHDSRGLLELPSFSGPPGRALILNAPGGRRLIADVLTKRGWTVTELAVYQRIDLHPEPGLLELLKQQAAARGLMVLVSSAAMLARLTGDSKDGLQAVLAGQHFVVSSERLAGLAKDAGLEQVHLAKGADDAALAKAAAELAATLARDAAGP